MTNARGRRTCFVASTALAQEQQKADRLANRTKILSSYGAQRQ
jgi:hypothetical protein